MDRNGIIALRREGKTYSEIANVLKIPKSTVAWHLRNVKLSKSLQDNFLKNQKKNGGKVLRNTIISTPKSVPRKRG